MTPIVNQKDIKTLLKKDNLFADIYNQHESPPNWSRPQGFVTLSKIILEQQVSLASANAHFIKLDTYVKGITPHGILQLTDEEMRACQVSRQKSKYLRELSSAILNKNINLKELPGLNEVEIRSQLTNIKGIGNWTVDIYLMFCLQAKDIFPMGDIAVVNTIRELCGVKAKEEILSLAEKWKPFRSLATYFLWHHYLEKRKRKNDL
jgi:DNA-3-methyladenine glycosylase II